MSERVLVSWNRGTLIRLVSIVLCLYASRLQANDPPNIIFILCDDLGYGDIGVLHQNSRDTDKKFTTPNLDSMANEGAILQQHYCPAPVCAPSRASLLLGQHQGNAAIRDNQFDKALPNQPTIASVLKAAGYSTAIVGKYGLQGDQRYAMKKNGTKPSEWPAYPTKRGFDEFFGYVRHVDGHIHYPAQRWELGNNETHKSPKELWHNEEEISQSLDNCYTTDLFTAYAKHWISLQQAQSDRPFFLYLAYDTPHAALQVPSCEYPKGNGAEGGVQWIGEPGSMINTAVGTLDSYRDPETLNRGWSDVEERFATMVKRIDRCVGDLLQTLKDHGIDDNTLVVLSSDNGPHHESYLAASEYDPTSFESYGPFEGTKRDTWEGGIRVPTLAFWPSRIPAGTVDGTPSQFHDWMATFADAAGVPKPAICDGVSLLPTMTGAGARTPSTVYVEYNQNGRTKNYEDFEPRKRNQKRGQMQVILLEGYKGVRNNVKSHDDPFQIYDLNADRRERTNLADKSDSMRQLDQRMRDRVLQLRVSNNSAPRPYDGEPIAPVAFFGKPKPQGVLYFTNQSVPYVARANDGSSTAIRLQNTGAAKLGVGQSANMAMVRTVIQIPETGRYQFWVRSASPAIVRLHDFCLIDHASDHSADVAGTGEVTLQKGLHPLDLCLQCPGGNLDYSLQWAKDGGNPTEIPASAFFSRQ